MSKKDVTVARRLPTGAPFGLFKQLTTEMDRLFEEGGWPGFRFPLLRMTPATAGFTPAIDMFEKDRRLVTRIDLPGLKKEDVKVEVADGYLAISGERKTEVEEKKEDFYRCERGYGSFYRALPMPDGIKIDEIKATFVDGVLEVSVPLPTTPKAEVRTVEIQDPTKPVKAA